MRIFYAYACILTFVLLCILRALLCSFLYMVLYVSMCMCVCECALYISTCASVHRAHAWVRLTVCAICPLGLLPVFILLMHASVCMFCTHACMHDGVCFCFTLTLTLSLSWSFRSHVHAYVVCAHVDCVLRSAFVLRVHFVLFH